MRNKRCNSDSSFTDEGSCASTKSSDSRDSRSTRSRSPKSRSPRSRSRSPRSRSSDTNSFSAPHSKSSRSTKKSSSPCKVPLDCKPNKCEVNCDIKHRFIVKLGKCKVKKTVQYNHIIVTDVTHHIKETINCVHKKHKDVDNGEVTRNVCGDKCPQRPSCKDEVKYDKEVIARSEKILKQTDLKCKPCNSKPVVCTKKKNGDVIE